MGVLLNKNSLTSIAGGLWCVIGVLMIFRGFGLYQLAGQEQHSTQISILLSLVTAVLIGLAKGRFVLSKTARKNKASIYEL